MGVDQVLILEEKVTASKLRKQMRVWGIKIRAVDIGNSPSV